MRVRLALVLGLMAAPAAAQQIETPPPPPGEPRAVGYLPKDAVDFRRLLPAPPAADSVTAVVDWAAVEQLNGGADTARFAEAEQDSRFLYRRFDQAFGAPVERTASPALIRLLNRVRRDVADPTFAAKDLFQRPRPYQLRQLPRVCGAATPPKPDPTPQGGSSYPSGHSAYGWMVAYVLAEVAPERAGPLLDKARDYAESRVVCGVHFPSDTEAGRSLAAAVVGRLFAERAFRRDLAAARAEHIARSSAPPIPAVGSDLLREEHDCRPNEPVRQGAGRIRACSAP